MISPTHPIVRAASSDPRILARFWALVDRAESADACWEWNGRRSCGRHAMFTVKHHSVSAARLAWFAATGEFPLGGRMRRTCQNLACVRPDHLEWELGLMTEQVLRAQSEGYVSVSIIRRQPESLDDDVPGEEAVAV